MAAKSQQERWAWTHEIDTLTGEIRENPDRPRTALPSMLPVVYHRLNESRPPETGVASQFPGPWRPAAKPAA